jgi:hypothetical protein
MQTLSDAMIIRIYDTESRFHMNKKRGSAKAEPILTNPSVNKTKVKINCNAHQKPKSGAVR